MLRGRRSARPRIGRTATAPRSLLLLLLLLLTLSAFLCLHAEQGRVWLSTDRQTRKGGLPCRPPPWLLLLLLLLVGCYLHRV